MKNKEYVERITNKRSGGPYSDNATVRNPTDVANALHNATDRSGASDDYVRGIIVGVASGLMAMGFSGPAAINYVKRHMPEHNRGELLPESWRD